MDPIGVWIRLTMGYVALVDREDEPLAAFRWTACLRRNKTDQKVRVYAVREWTQEGSKKRTFLHQAVFGATEGDTDHRDGDTLNNRRANLRAATRSQNNANAIKRGGASSRFKGVHWHKQAKCWTVQVKGRHIGQFKREENAATAYNFIAEQEYGEFARYNLP